MSRFVLFLLVLSVHTAWAQTPFARKIVQHRDAYRAEFLKSANSPLRTQQALDSLEFYAPDSLYSVEATVRLLPGAQPFDMPTYSGTAKPHVAYALLTFMLQGKPLELTLYRSLTLVRLPQFRDYLFLPFKDATSGQDTYGGGRYIDFRLADMKHGKLTLDFNKAYNPYCAYSDGYACPIPPKENRLTIPVKAGEKNYGGKKH